MPAVSAAAAAVLVLAGFGAYLATREPTVTAASTLTVTGKITIPTTFGPGLDEQCAGAGGYSDISIGAAVAVTDSGGKTVAIGELQMGHVSRANYPQQCAFAFTVDKVPAGLKFYSVEVTHRGRVQFTETQLANPVELTLGSSQR